MTMSNPMHPLDLPFIEEIRAAGYPTSDGAFIRQIAELAIKGLAE
jgi:hypothetical protein